MFIAKSQNEKYKSRFLGENRVLFALFTSDSHRVAASYRQLKSYETERKNKAGGNVCRDKWDIRAVSATLAPLRLPNSTKKYVWGF